MFYNSSFQMKYIISEKNSGCYLRDISLQCNGSFEQSDFDESLHLDTMPMKQKRKTEKYNIYVSSFTNKITRFQRDFWGLNAQAAKFDINSNVYQFCKPKNYKAYVIFWTFLDLVMFTTWYTWKRTLLATLIVHGTKGLSSAAIF